MPEPRIYTRNYIDSQSVISTSHGGTTSLLYDRSNSPRLTSSGSNTDLLFSVFIYFYENGSPISRYINTTFLLNHNMVDWYLLRWNGSWTEVANYLTTGSSGAPGSWSTYASHSRFSTNAMRIDVGGTSPSNVEKMIGEVIFCDTVLSCSDLTAYDTKWRERSKEIVLGDGSIHRVNVKDASGRIGKYEARCRWTHLTKSERDNLKSIKDAGQPFLFQPESVSVPEDIYYVHWSNAWDDKYMSNFKGAGYEVLMDVKEV